MQILTDMQYKTRTEGNIAIFELDGSMLGDNDRDGLVADFNAMLSGDIRHFILDLSQLKHINSTGLGIFITLYTKVRGKGGDMYLTSPNITINNLLNITKLNSVFNIADSIDTALKKLNAK